VTRSPRPNRLKHAAVGLAAQEAAIAIQGLAAAPQYPPSATLVGLDAASKPAQDARGLDRSFA